MTTIKKKKEQQESYPFRFSTIRARVGLGVHQLEVDCKLVIEESEFSLHELAGEHLQWVHQREPQKEPHPTNQHIPPASTMEITFIIIRETIEAISAQDRSN